MAGGGSFEVHHAEVGPGSRLAYWHEGRGGVPLLLVHGWPETKRIWARNVAPLADAGFEVIAPDLRGFGDSGPAPDGCYDPAAYATDLYRLVRGLGHSSCVAAGGDLGGTVMLDLGLRYRGFVERQCFFNSSPPYVKAVWKAAGIPEDPPRARRPAADYSLRQGHDADGLLAELDTAERRRRYIASFYGHRLWAAPGSFGVGDVDFHTAPFADAATFRSSLGSFEVACGTRDASDVPKLFEVHPVPTLVLYGPEDHSIAPTFPQKCRVSFAEPLGPFVLPDTGHWVQWEQATLFNRSLAAFLA